MKELEKSRLWWLPADLGVAWGAGLDECKERYPDLIVSESETQLALRFARRHASLRHFILSF